MELKKSEKLLIEAVHTIINKDGFSKLGINYIAKTAACDKVLIYRYFGGLEGLITAWAQKHDYYIQAYSSLCSRIESIKNTNLKDITKEILLTQLDYTRKSRTLQALLVWELSGDSTFKAIRDLREENGFKLQSLLNDKLESGKKEVNMYITVLIASIYYVVLSSVQYPYFNGIDFSEESSWTAFKNTLCDYIDMLFHKLNK